MRVTAALISVLLAAVTASAASVPVPHSTEDTNAAAATSTAEDGIKIDVTWHVDCDRKTKNNDVISMAYNLTLADGTKIESTKPGQSFKFTLGAGEVIEGWDMGLKDMCIGDRRTLTIPPEYGYGLDAVGPIPSNSTLVFYTELMGIDGVPNPSKTFVTPVTPED